jgi:hypothetical protein
MTAFNMRHSRDMIVPGAKLEPHDFQVTKPGRMKIMDINGDVNLIGYGIGDIVTVMKYNVMFCVPETEQLIMIPLANGEYIIWYDDDIEMKFVNL